MRVASGRISFRVLERWCLGMATSIEGTLRMECTMEGDRLKRRLSHIKETSGMDGLKVMVILSMLEGRPTREPSSLTESTDRANTLIKMGQFMKENGSKTKEMARVSLYFPIISAMKVISNRTRCVVWVDTRRPTTALRDSSRNPN